MLYFGNSNHLKNILKQKNKMADKNKMAAEHEISIAL
jgi:hypothetical protein